MAETKQKNSDTLFFLLFWQFMPLTNCQNKRNTDTEGPFFMPQDILVCHSGGDALTFLAHV